MSVPGTHRRPIGGRTSWVERRSQARCTQHTPSRYQTSNSTVRVPAYRTSLGQYWTPHSTVRVSAYRTSHRGAVPAQDAVHVDHVWAVTLAAIR
eukprot:3920528-Rhodomonas_salina.3